MDTNRVFKKLKGANGREAMENGDERVTFSPAMDLRMGVREIKFEQLNGEGIRGNLEFKLPVSYWASAYNFDIGPLTFFFPWTSYLIYS